MKVFGVSKRTSSERIRIWKNSKSKNVTRLLTLTEKHMTIQELRKLIKTAEEILKDYPDVLEHFIHKSAVEYLRSIERGK